METLMLPQLYCPFPARLNPYAEAAQTHTLSWAQQLGLTDSDAAQEQLRKAAFADLAARAYPDANEDTLCLLSDYITWLSLFDNTLAHIRTDEKATFIRDTAYAFMDITEQRPVVWLTTGNPIIVALSNLWQRIREKSETAWQQRFIKNMEQYFDGWLWKARNIRMRRVPSRQEYLQMRPNLGAVHTVVDLIEVANNACLPEDVRQHSLVTELGLLCGNIICWSDDIFTMQKETAALHMHNLVQILQHERHGALDEAIQTATHIHNNDVLLFMELERQLPSFNIKANEQLQLFVNGLRCWIRGNQDWWLQQQ